MWVKKIRKLGTLLARLFKEMSLPAINVLNTRNESMNVMFVPSSTLLLDFYPIMSQ